MIGEIKELIAVHSKVSFVFLTAAVLRSPVIGLQPF